MSACAMTGLERPVPPGSVPTEARVVIPCDAPCSGRQELDGVLTVPRSAQGLVVLVEGIGSIAQRRRDRFLARVLGRSGLGTLRVDLLTAEEEAVHEVPRRMCFDVEAVAPRLLDVTRWLDALPQGRALRLALFGAGAAAPAVLLAAAALPGRVAAVVACGGRPDRVAPDTLGRVASPVLLLVGRRDADLLSVHCEAMRHLRDARLAIVPGEARAGVGADVLHAVSRLTSAWLGSHLLRAAGAPCVVQ